MTTEISLLSGTTRIDVVACELVDAPAEAIMVSANNWLDAGSGEALKVKRRVQPAKPTYDAECQRLASQASPAGIPQGTAVAMPGYSLTAGGPSKVVLQAITIRYPHRGSPHGRVKATPDVVYRATRAALDEAVHHDAYVVATYLMAAREEYSTKPAHVMADAMCRALVGHVASGAPIRQIMLCEPDPDRRLLAAQALRHARAVGDRGALP